MRAEFSKATKLAAWERCNGHCESCGKKILTRAEYDHIIEDTLTHDNSLANCACLCQRCHAKKTAASRPAIDKTRRIIETRQGLRAPKQKIAKRANPWGRREA